jgi:hypothetical protein
MYSPAITGQPGFALWILDGNTQESQFIPLADTNMHKYHMLVDANGLMTVKQDGTVIATQQLVANVAQNSISYTLIDYSTNAGFVVKGFSCGAI